MDPFEQMLGIFVMLLGCSFAMGTLGIIIHMYVKAARRERRMQRAIESYERIIVERMDVIKTAIAVGFDSDQLDALDSRLEKLIGRERLQGLLDEHGPSQLPVVSAVLEDELRSAVENIKRERNTARRAGEVHG